MTKALDPAIAKVFKEMDMDPKEAVWDCHGTWVACHRALEKVAAIKGIVFDRPAIIEAKGEQGVAAICVFGKLGDKEEWSIGEAAPKNNKNTYPWAMAEKRAKDRVILKLIGLHGAVYSEEEADDFKKSAPDPRGDDKPIKTKRTMTGPITDVNKLVEELRRIYRDLRDCTDLDQFDACYAEKTNAAVMEQARKDLNDLWEGPVEEGKAYKDAFMELRDKLVTQSEQTAIAAG